MELAQQIAERQERLSFQNRTSSRSSSPPTTTAKQVENTAGGASGVPWQVPFAPEPEMYLQ